MMGCRLTQGNRPTIVAGVDQKRSCQVFGRVAYGTATNFESEFELGEPQVLFRVEAATRDHEETHEVAPPWLLTCAESFPAETRGAKVPKKSSAYVASAV